MKPDFGITPELVALCEEAELFVGHPYLCPAGKPTIGFGHRIPSLDHPDVTLEWAKETLAADLVRYRNQALALSPLLANEPEPRLAAITELCFNAGSAAYGASHLRLQVNRRQWKEAAANLRTWNHAHDAKGRLITLAGLTKRRAITAGWLEKGA